MIHKSKLFIFLLVFLIFFNFIIEPKKIQAAATSIASEYGSKFLMFLYGSLAIGVSFDGPSEAQAAFDKWLLDESNWDPPAPDPGMPPNNPNDAWRSIASGIIAANLLKSGVQNLLGNLRDFWNSLGAKEGENTVYPDYMSGVINGYSYKVSIVDNMTKSVKLLFNINGLETLWSIGNNYYVRNVSNFSVFDIYPGTNSLGQSGVIVKFGYQYDGYENGKYVDGTGFYANTQLFFYSGPIPIPESSDPIRFNVRPYSPVITNDPITDIPQPHINPNVERDKISPIITPDGKEKGLYPGTIGDFADDWINNTTWEDYQNDVARRSPPYTLNETQSGTEIEIGTIIPTPFPNPDSSPIEDTSEFQGKNIGLLQSIINWLKLLLENIVSLPTKIVEGFKTLLESLFIPDPKVLQDMVMTIKNTVQQKIGAPDTSFANSILNLT